MGKTGYDHLMNRVRIDNIPDTGVLTGNYEIDFHGCWWECVRDQDGTKVLIVGAYPELLILTAEEIANITESRNGLGNIQAINRLYRVQDTSTLWPVNNKYNLTEYAIRKARLFQQQAGSVYGLEYCYLLESIMSEKVNR